MNRRYFIKSGGIALASFGVMASAPSFVKRALAETIGAPGARRKTLIAIFQRGAVDGLNVVVPYAEHTYYDLRPNIAVAKPNGGAEAAIDLDGFFGLHPSLASFKPLWDSKRLAIVHASGSPDNTRSHFDAQDYMESATPGVKSTADGWLNRFLQVKPDPQKSLFRAVSMTQNMPRAMQGRASTLAISNLADFNIRAGQSSASVQGGFEAMYDDKFVKDALHGTGKETFEAINYLKQVNPGQYKPENGAVYPQNPLGNALRQTAQLIKAGVGLEVAFTDIGGWDTHVNEGNQQGQLSNLLRQFSTAITALYTDLGQRMDDVVILTMSEFGRTVKENGNRGTDHGHANAMFVVGNSVRGGKVYGDWPGLENDQLYEGRDLALTTDFRDVFGEIAAKHLGAANLKGIFPGYAGGKFRGVLG
ncbi:MAG TPA: DUF1501 domain-containing protein [Pyrinomonadaceae bacterium]|nr:DUF1501 domain-containing protein [Pyrinomonadaceae bacterium]